MDRLKAYKHWIAWSLFGLSVLGLTFAASKSLSYRYCKADYATEYAKPYKPDFYEKVHTFFVCEGITIDVNGELLTALGTIAIAGFTLTLWLTSRDQGRLTEIAIRDARIASQRELRAYVSAIPGNAFFKEGAFCAVVRVENTGNTPAFETSCLWTLKVGEPPGLKELEFNFQNPDNDPIPTFVLYPRGIHSSVEAVKLSDADLASIKAGTHVIRAFGVVHYRDAFNDPQFGTFSCYMDWTGYEMFVSNYNMQPGVIRKPVQAPFKFSQGGNRASFS